MFHLTADSLYSPHVRHAFYGRLGGVSGGLFDSLNCALASSDSPAAVQRNRALVAEHLGIPHDRLLTLKQIHGNRVVTLQREDDLSHYRHHPADGFACALPQVGIGILTADCAPILFMDATARIIGAAHAGWQGAFHGIVPNTLQAMVALGANPHRIRAAIGPCIEQRSYEVDAVFHQRFLTRHPDNAAFFLPNASGRYQFNLKAFVAQQLQQAGIRHVQTLPNDTYTEAHRFFSFRRTTHHRERDYGRQLSVISLR